MKHIMEGQCFVEEVSPTEGYTKNQAHVGEISCLGGGLHSPSASSLFYIIQTSLSACVYFARNIKDTAAGVYGAASAHYRHSAFQLKSV